MSLATDSQLIQVEQKNREISFQFGSDLEKYGLDRNVQSG